MFKDRYIQRDTPLNWIPTAWWPAHDDKDLGLMSDIQSAHDIERVLNHVGGRDTVVQAGAAMGIWAKRLAQEFRAVYTFEPHPQNFRAAVLNLLDEENVVIQQAALSDNHAMVSIDFPEHPENHGGFRIVGHGDVPSIRIDDLSFTGSVDLLYLDIEGAEFMALRGAVETIRVHKPVIVIEDKPGCCMHFGYRPGDIGVWLQGLGYKQVGTYHGGRDKVYAV